MTNKAGRFISSRCGLSKPENLLLKAALLDTDEAISAWHEWNRLIKLEDIEFGSYQLLPLLYKNLQRLNVSDKQLPKLKGVYRHTWSHNQQLKQNASQVLGVLHENKIPTMLVNGAGLTMITHGDWGLRPMGCFDIMVPCDDALKAFALIEDLGWQSTGISGLTRQTFQYRHALGYSTQRGIELGLHWRLFTGFNENDEDFIWRSKQPIELEGIVTSTLCPTDHLFSVCIHGARYSSIPPIRWIADLITLLRTNNLSVDWQRLIKLTRRQHCTLPVLDGLTYLAGIDSDLVPSKVLKQLSAQPVHANELKYYQVMNRSPKQLRNVPAIHWNNYRRSCSTFPDTGNILGFLPYLQYIYQKKNLLHLTIFFVRRLFSKTRIWIERRPTV